MSNRPIKRIVIVGAGFEGWLTAASLAKSLTPALDITVCAAAGADDWDPLYSVQPWHPRDSLRLLGITDLVLTQHHDAMYSLGLNIALPCLTPGNHTWPYGRVGVDYSGIAFHHHWCRERARGSEFFTYSPGARAIALGAFAPPAPRNAIGALQHEIARHVDTSNITTALRRIALAAGVERWRGEFKRVERESDQQRIATILTDGEPLNGDLYIDCSGPLRLLANPTSSWLEDGRFETFSVTTAAMQARKTMAPCHFAVGDSDGWKIDIPLQTRCIEIQLSSSITDNHTTTLAAGRADNAWQNNHVAVGLSGVQLLPVLPLQMLLLSQSIERIVTLLPGADCAAEETLEFNQLTARDADEATALLSLLEYGRRHNATPSANRQTGNHNLDRKIALFTKRGWVGDSDDALVDSHDWVKTFMLLAMYPTHADLMTDRLEPDQRRQMLENLDTHIGTVVDEFPTLQRYMVAALNAGNAANNGRQNS